MCLVVVSVLADDRAALVWWGDSAQLNFLLSDYLHELPLLETLSRDEVVALLRRGSSGFSRGQSRFRGVTAHHQQTKWEARIGRCNGDNYMVGGMTHTHTHTHTLPPCLECMQCSNPYPWNGAAVACSQ